MRDRSDLDDALELVRKARCYQGVIDLATTICGPQSMEADSMTRRHGPRRIRDCSSCSTITSNRGRHHRLAGEQLAALSRWQASESFRLLREYDSRAAGIWHIFNGVAKIPSERTKGISCLVYDTRSIRMEYR